MKKLLSLLVCVFLASLLCACNPQANKTTVTLDLNGGSIVGETVITATQGENLSITEPTKTGYDFIGWTYNDEPVSLTPFTLNEEAVTLKADWQAKTVNYTFNLMGGSGDFTGGTINYGDSTSGIKSLIPQGESGDFNCWIVNGEELGDVWTYLPSGNEQEITIVACYTGTFILTFVHYDNTKEYVSVNISEGVDTETLPLPKTKTGYRADWEINYDEMLSITESRVINAVIKPNIYTVVFKNGTLTDITTYTYDKEVELPSPQKNGYEFLGWSPIENDRTNLISGNYVWNFSKAITLYAIYNPKTFKINYDTSNIKVAFDLYDGQELATKTTQSVAYNANYSLYTVKTKNDIASVVWLYNGNEISMSDVWKITQDVTLTAKVTANEVDIAVKIDLNGGTGSEYCTLTLQKPLTSLASTITAPRGKRLAGFTYKGRYYSITDVFDAYDYDGTKLVAVYKNQVFTTVKIDLNGGTGETTGVIEVGKAMLTITNRPKAPSGQKLVGFYYKEKMYLLTDVWDVEDYDGESLIAHYIADDEDWSPIPT